jgi:hypothetical protein
VLVDDVDDALGCCHALRTPQRQQLGAFAVNVMLGCWICHVQVHKAGLHAAAVRVCASIFCSWWLCGCLLFRVTCASVREIQGL